MLDLERVEDVLDVGRDVGDAAARLRRRAAVAGPVVRDDPQAAPARELEVGRVREPAAGRSVVLEHDEPVRVALVVHVQGAPVAQPNVVFAHSPGFSGVPGLPFGKSSLNRRATGSGTRAETSPPNAAISLTPLEDTNDTCGLAIT